MDKNDPRDALRDLVDIQLNKLWPEGNEWLERLKALMKDGTLFDETTKYIPLPMVLYNRQLDVEAANAKLLEEAGITEKEIADEKIAILDTGSDRLDSALTLVFHTKTTIVNSLVDPLAAMRLPGSKHYSRVYQSAIVFPCMDGGDQIMRGIVLFLPMEL